MTGEFKLLYTVRMATLEIITGPMFCGKSTELIRRLETAKWAGKNILVIKPASDVRTGTEIASRGKDSGTEKFVRKAEFPAVSVSSEKEILRLFRGKVFDVLAVDEAQFFDEWFVGFVEKLLMKESGRDFRVIACGLDLDAWRKPFGIMPNLMAMANGVLKLQAVCFSCRSEQAVFSQKLSGVKKLVDVGDSEKYEARCRKCHVLPGMKSKR